MSKEEYDKAIELFEFLRSEGFSKHAGLIKQIVYKLFEKNDKSSAKRLFNSSVVQGGPGSLKDIDLRKEEHNAKLLLMIEKFRETIFSWDTMINKKYVTINPTSADSSKSFYIKSITRLKGNFAITLIIELKNPLIKVIDNKIQEYSFLCLRKKSVFLKLRPSDADTMDFNIQSYVGMSYENFNRKKLVALGKGILSDLPLHR